MNGCERALASLALMLTAVAGCGGHNETQTATESGGTPSETTTVAPENPPGQNGADESSNNDANQ